MTTIRRKIRNLHREATSCYLWGLRFDYDAVTPAPSDPVLRIAFDAGRTETAAAKRQSYGGELPLSVWQDVLAEWLRRDQFGICT